MKLLFDKMQALGNDFVVFDTLNQAITPTSDLIRHLADRHLGIGCDQVLIVSESTQSDSDFDYSIYNANGQPVGQCGNGARCIGQYIVNHQLSKKKTLRIKTSTTQMIINVNDPENIAVEMGQPNFGAASIPIKLATHNNHYTLEHDNQVIQFSAVNVGNPHAVITVDEINTAAVSSVGASLCKHDIFPEQANIGFMQILNRQQIALRVYERGVGETLACGSGACAAVAIGIKQGALDSQVTVSLPGGDCYVSWPSNQQSLILAGPAVKVFEGSINL